MFVNKKKKNSTELVKSNTYINFIDKNPIFSKKPNFLLFLENSKYQKEICEID